MHRLGIVFFVLAGTLAAQTNAVPSFDWQSRWDNYLERTYSWKKIVGVGAETAFDQTFQLKKCGRPPYCFPRDFGGALARRTTRTTIELGMGALLHEDLRRRPSGLSSVRQRVVYSLLHAPLARNANGGWEPAYSRFAGSFGAVAVTSVWRGRPLTTGRLFEGAGWTMTTYFQDALFTEFEPDMRRAGLRLLRRFRHHETVSAPVPLVP